ncbi:LysR family transcriptional regulator [Marinomonas mediterranea]|jgi:transcriptional regulator, LysR family|uniref:Transcriptional regulator, LysR family n=1 Tax=Marinomonas mediterranea (strain ATCC 700492 / JCM 21426 / NBRC 103028 / MMB-1) TaxID=717774 RepID=F2K0K5_MARM1|nr:LysR family transcriptional regulator [Marinomonas mediterranea]ADZ90989.1 transcriptional regulator, LysR family [Marinomonas mediterranea MMB-1]WCN09028.1 LysR family transcriptional regulator [Marinomonas mediterranea]WCN13062.1 LysR family transcriptional regulator [Marinomonas mediterranea]WCN17131.1 LysR family transcriptional regulator [Marinomonas mediterranea MMB-1]
MKKRIGWELYRSFLAVLQEGSLSAAARATGSTQPTLGRHIDELETHVGYSLFIRTQSGLVPTERAVSLEKLALDMSHLAQTFERVALSNEDGIINGTVRLTTSDIVGVEVLPAVLSEFQKDNPKIEIELVLSDMPQDLLNREADIAVRMFRPKQSQLIARKVGTCKFGFCASKRYIENHALPKTAEELRQHPLIGYDKETDFIRRNTRDLGFDVDRSVFNYRADSNIVQLALIRAGLGIGICQLAVIKYDNNLIPILEGAIKLELDVWVTMHEDLRNNPLYKAVFDALVLNLKKVYPD